MPGTKVIKQKPVEATRNTIERPSRVKERVSKGKEKEIKVSNVCKNRAASCPRCPPQRQQQRGRCVNTGTNTGAYTGAASRTNCARRTRSTSTAPRHTGNLPKASPDCRRGNPAAISLKNRDTSTGGPVQREHRSPRAEAKYANQR